MNYTYLSFLSLVILIYLIYIKLYRFGFKQFSKQIEKWSAGIIITGIFFYVIYLCLHQLNEIENARTENQDLLWLTIISTGIGWLYAHAYKDKDPSSALKSTKKDDSFFTPRVFKKISDVKNDQITTYPRITVDDITNDHESKLIFDSSDFERINNTFGAMNDLQQSFFEDRNIEINGKVYITKHVKVDFLNIFDDYSLLGHTKIYSGIDTPYNIQIIVEVIEQN